MTIETIIENTLNSRLTNSAAVRKPGAGGSALELAGVRVIGHPAGRGHPLGDRRADQLDHEHQDRDRDHRDQDRAEVLGELRPPVAEGVSRTLLPAGPAGQRRAGRRPGIGRPVVAGRRGRRCSVAGFSRGGMGVP